MSVYKKLMAARVALNSRTIYGSRCRKCGEVRNPLSQVAPDIAKQWHPTKNGKLTPDAISAGSRQRVWWLCSVAPSHQWQAGVEQFLAAVGDELIGGRPGDHESRSQVVRYMR